MESNNYIILCSYKSQNRQQDTRYLLSTLAEFVPEMRKILDERITISIVTRSAFQ